MKTLSALFALIGATIGIGVLALPYTFGASGVVPSILLLIIALVLTLILNSLYVEVLLHVKGRHQFAGYAGKFFGNTGKLIATGALLVGAYGACLAYIIQGGIFLNTLIPAVSPFYFSLAFFFCIALVGLLNLRVFTTIQSVMVVVLLALITVLCVLGIPHIQVQNFVLVGNSFEKILLPYGVLLFAFSGYSIIPEMGEITEYKKISLKRAVLGGTSIVAAVYIVFSFLVLGISGGNVSEDAVTGLSASFGSDIVKLVALVALLPVTTSFISLSRVSQDMFVKDLKLSRPLGWFFALYPPLVLFLSGKLGIVRVLEISGGITVGLTGAMLIAMYFKMCAESGIAIPLWKRVMYYTVMAVFVLGIGYEVWRGIG